MSAANMSITTNSLPGNVIVMFPQGPRNITARMTRGAVVTASRLLRGWFTTTLIQDTDDDTGEREDYLLVHQTDGPLLGHFKIQAGPRNNFSVFSLGHDYETSNCGYVCEPIKLGQFPNIEEAVRAISCRVEDQLVTWGLSFDTSD